MDVTIIGAGNMGRALGRRFVDGGHNVKVLDRHPEKAESVASELGGSAEGGETSPDAIAGDVVVFAVYYPGGKEMAEQYAGQIEGKTVVDISNPVNESFDDLVDLPAGSAAEEIAAVAPDSAKVVKAFNTTFASTLAEGKAAGEVPLDVLIAGDDEDAKRKVAELAESGGLRPIDAGELRRARELEVTGLLHIRLQGPLDGGYATALKIVP
jgi:8-hydroxy-5-deazaflavin:NADPH oxidoreductase